VSIFLADYKNLPVSLTNNFIAGLEVKYPVHWSLAPSAYGKKSSFLT